MSDVACKSVAIVGVGAILPDAPNARTFWENVKTGRYSISDVSAERWDPGLYYDPDPKAPDKTYSKIGGWVRNAEWDPIAWRLPIPPLVAAAMDEGQKWAVAGVREALNDYGYPQRALNAERTAVILGNAMGGEKHYLTTTRTFFPELARELENSPRFAALDAETRRAIRMQFHANLCELLPEITEDTMPGELSNCLAGRIANLFNFHGPNYTTDAACASAMAAMTAAIEGLAQGDYDAVVTGGVDRNMGASSFVKFCKIGALSATGTRPYADGADGFVMGEGAGVFLLKRLADAERDGDRIYAVIRGVGGASDGRGKGITAPNPIGQKFAIERAWKNAGISPETVGLIEGHGTSTRVGDVVEVESLAQVFSALDLPRKSVALGSVKSNIGHLKGAAGAAGILKATFALYEKTLPPSLNFARPNPSLDFEALPFYVNTELRPWETTPDRIRRAGVSAFGFGGTNFHIVLEEYVPGRTDRNGTFTGWSEADEPDCGGRDTKIACEDAPAATSGAKAPLRGALLLGGANPAELIARLQKTLAEAEAGRAPAPAAPAAADLASPERIAIDYGDAKELAEKAVKAIQALTSDNPAKWRALRSKGVFRCGGARRKVAFLYTGQGSQYVNMLHELRDLEPTVAETFAEADRVSSRLLPKPLTQYLFADSADSDAMAQAEENLRQTAITQPSVLTVDYALTRLFESYGVRPDMAMGHSLGEYGALVASGAFSFESALEAVSARGREMTKVSVADNGLMAAVMAPLEDIERILKAVDGYVVIANLNSRRQAVIGGATSAVEAAMEAFKRAGFNVIKLSVSHAFHTSIVAPASEPLKRQLARLTLSPPKTPIISNVTGDFYPMNEGCVSEMLDLLGRQVASPVQFVKGLQTLYDAGVRVFVEVGPKRALQGFVEDVFENAPDVIALSANHPKLGDVVSFNHALCGLYAAGIGASVESAAHAEVRHDAVSASVAPLRAQSDARRAEAEPEPIAQTTRELNMNDQKSNRTHFEVSASPDAQRELGRLFAEFLERGLAVYSGSGARARDGFVNGKTIAITGASLGLPGVEKVFDDGNVGRILRGEQLIDVIPTRWREAIRDKHITRLVKSDAGGRFEVIEDVSEVVKLAGRGGKLDLVEEFGVPADRLPALDNYTKLAIAAGLEALRDAGIPLTMRYKTTTKGTKLPERWGLAEAMRDETGVIFAAAFPGLDSFASDLNRYHADHARREKIELLEHLRARANGDAALGPEIDRLKAECQSELERDPYVFDRRFLFRVLAMGHSQFAELIGARGPNTQINSACASTTQAVSVAEDWIRTGRARRVVIVAADDITSDTLLEWFGAGFLATGAGATDEEGRGATRPFDRRRHGMILGMGAVALVLESDDAARERGLLPICEVLGSVTANSAFHGTRLDVGHITQVMETLIAQAEARHGIRREEIAKQLVFVSHETYTPARGGSASAEVHALRHVFGSQADAIVIANTKGFTGHAMGAGVEDVVAIKALETGIVPPVANFKEVDPELGPLNLSKGGVYPIRYALRLGAGFGSQISMTLMRWVETPDGVRRKPEDLGFQYRIVDASAWNAWLKRAAGREDVRLEVVRRTLRIADEGRELTSPAEIAIAARTHEVEASANVQSVASGNGVAASAHPSPQLNDEGHSENVTPAGDGVKDRVLALVSEKTGYPIDMLALDLDLEADLGVDTVKQAELFAAVRAAYDIPRDENLKLRDFPTLAHVIQFVYDRRPKPAQPEESGATSQIQQPEATTASAPSADGDDVKTRVLALVAEKTGYPTDMLDLDLDLEADLGVDTVKQAELFAAVRAAYDIPRDENLKLRDFPTLAHVIQFVYDRRPKPAQVKSESPSQMAPSAPMESGVSGKSDEDDAVKQTVLTLVSEKTGYPTDMLDLDLDLEADLGVDTVKQAELFAAVRAAYDIPRDENLKLRDFPTLAHVIQFVYDRRPKPAQVDSEVEPQVTESSVLIADQTPTERRDEIPNLIRTPIPVLRPALDFCTPTGVVLQEGSRIVVASDEGGVAETLQLLLAERGVDVFAFDPGADLERIVDEVRAWRGDAPIQGVYWLPALDVEGDVQSGTEEAWNDGIRRRVKSLYVVMRELYEDIAAAERFLIAGVRLGGRHGYDATGAVAPMGGAVTGFVKTFKRERPLAIVKAVDFAQDATPKDIAEQLIGETARDASVVELGYQNGLRWAIGLREAERASKVPGMTLDRDTVFVITGAAGSIVSAITSDLAGASGGTFYLLDRVPSPNPNNPDLEKFVSDRDGLRRDLFERMKAEGLRATPAAVEKEVAALEREYAALEAIRAVERSGGRARYVSVNLLDADGVARAFEEIRRESGRVDVLIHAAGLEISHFLPDKEWKEYDLVFDVKANGWRNVWSSLAGTQVGAVVAFSSIAGRFGNAGQSDYGAANDLLCKMLSSLRTTHPKTLGVAIDWTAWGGIGMASRGSIPKMMEAAGIDMLPPEIGIPIVREALTSDGASREIVVAGKLGVLMNEWDGDGGLDAESLSSAAKRSIVGKATGLGLYDGLTVEIALDPNVQPFLNDHRIDGIAVLPGVMGIEAFCAAAQLLAPGYAVCAVEDVEFMSPFKFYRDEPRIATVNVRSFADGDEIVAECRLSGTRRLPNKSEPQTTTHFTGRVRLSKTALRAEKGAPPDVSGVPSIGAESVYQVYFHGPAYQVVEKVWKCDVNSSVGLMRNDLPPNHHPSDVELISAPRVLELCFQTAGIAEIRKLGHMGLPMRINRVEIFDIRESSAGSSLFAVVSEPASPESGFDVTAVDEAGEVRLVMRGYRTATLPDPVDVERLAVSEETPEEAIA
jgi:acyl transferase domain-containing protein/NAD(P)-dependent dehydrogenase (short-subunit alcohol dehydrogenase family)/acyl carrier protein